MTGTSECEERMIAAAVVMRAYGVYNAVTVSGKQCDIFGAVPYLRSL